MPVIYVPVLNREPDSPSAFIEAFLLGLIDVIKHEAAFNPNGCSPTLEKIARNNPKVYQESIDTGTTSHVESRRLVDYQRLLTAIVEYQFGTTQLQDYNPVNILRQVITTTLVQWQYLDEIYTILNNIKRQTKTSTSQMPPMSSPISTSSQVLTATDKQAKDKYKELSQSELYKMYILTILIAVLNNYMQVEIDTKFLDENNYDPQTLYAVYRVLKNLKITDKIKQEISKTDLNCKDIKEYYEKAQDFVHAHEAYFIDIFCKDLLGSNYFKKPSCNNLTSDSLLLQALQSKPFNRVDGNFIAYKLEIKLHITTNPCDITELSFCSAQPIIRLYPPTREHSKIWHTILTIAPGSSKQDLCTKYTRNSTLTINEIKAIINSIKGEFNFVFFGRSYPKKLDTLVIKLKSEIARCAMQPTAINDIMEKIQTCIQDPIFKTHQHLLDYKVAYEKLSYLISRYAFVNGHRTPDSLSSYESEQKLGPSREGSLADGSIDALESDNSSDIAQTTKEGHDKESPAMYL